MNRTLLARTAVLGSGATTSNGSTTAGRICMEERSVTAPDLGSVHGTRLPFAGSTSADVTGVPALRDTQVDVYVPGSPPRGGPV